MTKEKARHIIKYKGKTVNGNSKYEVITVSKESSKEDDNFESWDNYNIENTFKSLKTRMNKKIYGITVYCNVDLIVNKIKEEFGKDAEIFKL